MPELHCQAGNHTWERPAQRGGKPLSCPEHSKPVSAPKSTEPKDEEAIRAQLAERAAKAREAKVRKAAERKAEEERIEREQAIADAAKYAKELPVKIKEYDTLLTATKKLKSKEEVDHAFNKLDNLQRAIITMKQHTRKVMA